MMWTVAQAEVCIRQLAPGFLQTNTDAAFMLQTARFYAMAADGQVQEAVPFARSHLAPLVRDNAARTEVMKVGSLTFPECVQQSGHPAPVVLKEVGSHSAYPARLGYVRRLAAAGRAQAACSNVTVTGHINWVYSDAVCWWDCRMRWRMRSSRAPRAGPCAAASTAPASAPPSQRPWRLLWACKSPSWCSCCG